MSSMDNLFKQFKESKGYVTDETTKSIIEEFIIWIDEQKNMSKNYSNLLNELGLTFNDSACAEIGKGKYDSIGKDFKTTIITTDDDIKPKGMFINTGFKVYNGMPTIVSQVTPKKIVFGKLNTKFINTFMTHNPYSDSLLDNWHELPSQNNNIIVGIYGHKSDKNLKDKISLLNRFKENLCGNYINEQTTFDNTYYEVVATKDKVKAKTLSL